MFTVTVAFGESNTPWTFVFNSHETAIAAASEVMADGKISDDFGQKALVNNVHGALVEEVAKSGEAHNLRMLAMAKTQAKYDNMLMNDPDPELKKVIQRLRTQEIQRRFVGNGFSMGPVPQN